MPSADLYNGHRAHFVLRPDMHDLLAAEGTQRHVTARDHDGRDVQTGAAHQVAGHDGIAGGKQHHAVKEVAVHGQLHLVGNQVAAGDLDILGVLKHHAVADGGRAYLQRQAACLTDTLLDALGKLVEMHVPGIVFIPAVYHGDQRTVQLLFRIAHAQHQAAAAFRRLTEFPAASHIFIFAFHTLFILFFNFFVNWFDVICLIRL